MNEPEVYVVLTVYRYVGRVGAVGRADFVLQHARVDTVVVTRRVLHSEHCQVQTVFVLVRPRALHYHSVLEPVMKNQ